ncbi:hypothetical protein C8039_01450 [Halogeometricum sp. wsp3]|nr:hypothetical protein C8039_01450 [Halogeometricum sp. wsp3]
MISAPTTPQTGDTTAEWPPSNSGNAVRVDGETAGEIVEESLRFESESCSWVSAVLPVHTWCIILSNHLR